MRCPFTCCPGSISPVKATSAMTEPVGIRDGQLFAEGIAKVLVLLGHAFSEATLYTENSYCVYRSLLYRCTNAHRGPWDDDDFVEVRTMDEIVRLRTYVDNADNDILAVVNQNKAHTDAYEESNDIAVNLAQERANAAYTRAGNAYGKNGDVAIESTDWDITDNTVMRQISSIGNNDFIFFTPASSTDKGLVEGNEIEVTDVTGNIVTFKAKTIPTDVINLTYFIARGV